MVMIQKIKKLPNGGHQARAAGTPPTLGNGKLLGTPPLIGLAERVACMPGWVRPYTWLYAYMLDKISAFFVSNSP